MHTKISSDNPYGYDRWGFAWEHVPKGVVAHLDFGCNDGSFLSTLKCEDVGRLVGVDISEEAVRKAQQLFPALEIAQIRKATDLPFNDRTFNSVTILDVLEHIYDQTELLAELNRVLKDGGTLIVTVPGQHLFSFLDRGNFKFRFPRLHRWYFCLFHSRQEYKRRYVSHPDGLIGDISAKKRWHEHFTRKKLSKLLSQAGFRVIVFDGTGFFTRVIGHMYYFLRWIKPLGWLLTKFCRLDSRLFESTHVFCLADKRHTT